MTAIEFQIKLISLKGSLTRFAFSLTSNQDEAKDLVQETFYKALKYRGNYADESNFKAWASTIMKNTFINNYRKSLIQNLYHDQSKEIYIVNKASCTGSDDPDSTYSVSEITQYIEQLEDKLRIPFNMHLNGYKYKEIANALNLNIGTLKSRIFNARKVLKEILVS